MILDTNALSAIADGDSSAMQIVERAEHVAVPVVVIGEYRFGIAQSRHRTTYERWLREWISSVTVLDVNGDTAELYATIALELKTKGRPIPANDLWIAALCRQYALPILSRDAHFDLAGVRRIDW